MVRHAVAIAVLVAAPLTMAVAVAVAVAVAAPAEAAATCAGHRVTMNFGPGNNRISGTPHADVIYAGAGDDIVDGRGGNDIICGGNGADILRGNAGNDALYGELDALVSEKIYIDQCAFPPPPDYCVYTHLEGDLLRGGPGNDLLVPGWDNRETTEPREYGGGSFPPWASNPTFPSNTFDKLRWDTSTSGVSVDLTRKVATGEGTDTIIAGGRYRIFTTAHNDVVVGSEGPDYIETGPGSDRVTARGGDDYVEVDGTGSTQVDSDAAYGGAGSDYLHSFTGADRLYGGDGEDQLFDNSRTATPDQMYGGAGVDVLADLVWSVAGQVYDGGGDGEDLLYANIGFGGVTWNMISGSMVLPGGGSQPATHVTAAGFHKFRAAQNPAPYGWVVTGTDQADEVYAPGRFDGLGGNDSYGGGDGVDTFNGGPGNDTYASDVDGGNTCTSVEVPNGACAP
jgi:Ca2+-binding RTX toxin-like protein